MVWLRQTPPFSRHAQQRLAALSEVAGCVAKLRMDGDKPYVTDNSNYIVDLYFEVGSGGRGARGGREGRGGRRDSEWQGDATAGRASRLAGRQAAQWQETEQAKGGSEAGR